MPRQRFGAILLRELARIPLYNAEGERLYRRLRRASARGIGEAGKVQPRHPSTAEGRMVKGLRPADLASF